ncbi:hypothetical protein U1Q18_044856 [Sarracenia purpurea var. burkii]
MAEVDVAVSGDCFQLPVDDEGVTAISTKIDGAGRTEMTKSIEDQASADTG